MESPATPSAPEQQPRQQRKKQDNKGETVRENGKGIVKAVPSGDTVTIISLDAARQGPPVERSITLSSISAPVLSNRKRREADQQQQDDVSVFHFFFKKINSKKN